MMCEAGIHGLAPAGRPPPGRSVSHDLVVEVVCEVKRRRRAHSQEHDKSKRLKMHGRGIFRCSVSFFLSSKISPGRLLTEVFIVVVAVAGHSAEPETGPKTAQFAQFTKVGLLTRLRLPSPSRVYAWLLTRLAA